MSEVTIVDYSAKYKDDFRRLNEAWIKEFFELEQEDIDTLNDPYKIIQKGGYVFVALKDEKVAGVCALRKADTDTYEFSKMAVDQKYQGEGIGKFLVNTAIEKAKQIGAKRIFLEGNTLLKASIHLYKKAGFQEIPIQESHYKRVNIVMEMLL